jgi:predicted cupin superfamily sugar epimerase
VTDFASSTPSEPLLADPVVLGMQPHPEGGWYRRIWTHGRELETPNGTRPLTTAVSYLLRPGEVSRWHRVRSAELWLWQGGGRVRLRMGGTGPSPDDATEVVELGIGNYLVVPADMWQTAEPVGERAVLVACVVSPGFDSADFELLSED